MNQLNQYRGSLTNSNSKSLTKHPLNDSLIASNQTKKTNRKIGLRIGIIGAIAILGLTAVSSYSFFTSYQSTTVHPEIEDHQTSDLQAIQIYMNSQFSN